MTTHPDIEFQKLIESLPDATVIVNREGTIVLVNPQVELLFGYPRQELLNQPLEILMPERFRAGHIHQRLGYYDNPHVRRMGKGLELYGLRKNGQEFPVDISLSPLEAGNEILVITSIRDITDRKKIEQALTEEKEHLNVTLHSIGDGVITVDTQGRVSFLNSAAEVLTGWSQAVAEGRPFLEVFHILHEKKRMPDEDPVKTVLATGKIVEFSGPTLLISRQGIEHDIVDCAAPIRDRSGGIIGVVLVFRDVTGGRKMEEEILRSRKLESIGLLAGGVAHDFNNLLLAIIGNIDLMKTDPGDDWSKGLDQIEKAALRAKEVASQFLTFTKGVAPVERVALIREIIEEAVGLATLGDKFPCGLAFSDPLWAVEVDAGKILQVIQNLLINASHAMPDGGEILVRAENVTLNKKEALYYSLKAGNYVKVSVKDSGIGIPKENLQKIFDPYFTTKEKGTGLGLSNAYAILRKHQGTILAESQVGAGSTFSFYLPAVLGETSSLSETREGQARFEAISSITPDAIVMVDGEQRIAFFNKGAETIFGYQASEIVGHPLEALLPSRFFESHREYFRTFSGGPEESRLMGERQVNIFGRRKDGSEFPAEVSISRWEKNGETVFAAILRDVTEQKNIEESLRRLAYYDSVTGLPNRKLYHDLLQKAIFQAQSDEKSVAVLLLDLDQFKEINDTLGHHRGDLLLQRVGERLKYGLFGHDIVARLGGDEFGLVLTMSSPEHATLVANKIMVLFKEPFEIEGLPVIVEGSIGISLCPEHGGNADSLMQRADVAMYVAKKEKRGYVFYDPVQDRHSPRRLALMGELRHAMENGQLFLVFQPKVDLKTRRLSGVEALIRWNHPKLGPVPPDQFILPAEQTGLIHPLTHCIFQSALRQGQIWRQMGMTIPIGINVSMRNLQNPRFPAEAVEIAASFGFDPGLVDLEITESAFMTSVERTVKTIHLLNQKGFHFSIDDFGTGNTSLSYLKKLAVKAIKIDRSFVKDMLTNEDDLSIVTATIDLAYRLNLRVVAEGVEDQATLERLADLGCDEAQGFHISRPLTVEDFDRWLAESPWGKQ